MRKRPGDKKLDEVFPMHPLGGASWANSEGEVGEDGGSR